MRMPATYVTGQSFSDVELTAGHYKNRQDLNNVDLRTTEHSRRACVFPKDEGDIKYFSEIPRQF